MYHGGRRKNESGRKLRGDNLRTKTLVHGIVERKGRIVARVGDSFTMLATGTLVKEYVLPETTIFSDEAVARDSGNLVFSSILARVAEMASHKPAPEALKNPTSKI
jgi:ISXO2-like transposase domain